MGQEFDGGGDIMVGLNPNPQQRLHRRRSFNKPSWLLCTIADLDERMKTLTTKARMGNNSDSFATRANSYYHQRPHLLELLNDLYNGYLSLADRYCQVLARDQHSHSRRPPSSSSLPTSTKLDQNIESNEGDTGEVIDSSDAESSLSFQPRASERTNADTVLADLVTKTVEYEIVLNEFGVVETAWGESSRKVELQKNLVDVLESERVVLLNDNVALGYRVAALAQENAVLASESVLLKRKVAELAQCVLKTREDHRVCMLSRKIEDLQGQIYGLERRNKEYYEQVTITGQGEEVGGRRVEVEERFWAGGKCFSFKPKKGGESEGKGFSSMKLWWNMVKKFDLLHCGSDTS